MLGELGIEANDRRLIEVWNKIDRLDAPGRARVLNLAERQAAENRPVPVSALSGEGLDRLIATIEGRLGESRLTIAEVLSKDMNEAGRLAVTVRADPDQVARVKAKFPT